MQTMSDDVVLDGVGLALVFGYLASLLLIGWLANRARGAAGARDFYLAGSSLGLVSLFFTLYATQYSGNTLLAAPGKAYRTGFDGLAIMLAVMGVVLVYATFATRLNRLAQQHGFITVADFVQWRFHNPRLALLLNLVLIVTLCTFALGNFKAIGLLLESVSGGMIGFATAVLVLALIMGVYESLGGMRGVVWTDVLQGLLLLLGCLIIFYSVHATSGAQSVTHWPGAMAELQRYARNDLQPIHFLSLVVLIAVGAAVYPQALQRIYAARDASVLKRSYRLMFFMPLLTTLPMILVGMSVAEWLPALPEQDSERVIILAIQKVIGSWPAMSWLLILCLAAALAAIMSTIDSALLTLGSILTQDVLQRDEDGVHSLRRSRLTSWCLTLLLALLAIVLPQTIWALMVFKFELLIQVAPAIILGVRWRQLRGSAVLAGLVIGLCCAVGFKLWGTEPWGIHSGVWGLLANLLVLVLWQRWSRD
ncbi:sodium:solute symporter family protein [Halieaceae bacterium IMCC14734]|uniref:Sodium:solute symporter family protein n=1 Tax=Candidatus Litorirhabdus singularis TaxID=2518993 RepID=A0ABT3TLP9_9GAMM|nr:sodium:solute symporter family protein [Candidatus Litorirhabdus singularis]MCX2982670.1 sodium:solute symporter family protein [Candidatus Litorirhabdus singularis]